MAALHSPLRTWYAQDGAPTPTQPVLEVVFAALSLCSAWEVYLLLRQRRQYAIRTIPGPISAAVGSLQAAKARGIPTPAALQESFVKSQRYGLDKSTVAIAEHVLNLVVSLASLATGALPAFYDAAGALVARVTPAYAGSEIPTTIIFLALASVASWALSVPLALYRTFVVEARHGFNKQTFATFAYDTAVSFAVSAAVAVPTVAALVSLVAWAGPNRTAFLLCAWAILSALLVAAVLGYPLLVAPLFNKFTPLPPGSLRNRIVALARAEAFPLSKVLVMDGSIRSAHSNAYFIGLCGAKQIVLFDTLVEQMDDDEVCAVLCHEMGHWALGHTFFGVARALGFLFCALFGFARFLEAPELLHAFGVAAAPAAPPPLFLALALFSAIAVDPLGPLLTFLFSAISRRQEYAADAHAVRLGHSLPLRQALVKLQVENLASFAVDPLYSAYAYSHPPLAERLAAIEALVGTFKLTTHSHISLVSESESTRKYKRSGSGSAAADCNGRPGEAHVVDWAETSRASRNRLSPSSSAPQPASAAAPVSASSGTKHRASSSKSPVGTRARLRRLQKQLAY